MTGRFAPMSTLARSRATCKAKLAGHAPVTMWGTGTPKREFIHVDDLAQGHGISVFRTSRARKDVPGNLRRTDATE